MGVFTFICKESGGEWSAKQVRIRGPLSHLETLWCCCSGHSVAVLLALAASVPSPGAQSCHRIQVTIRCCAHYGSLPSATAHKSHRSPASGKWMILLAANRALRRS